MEKSFEKYTTELDEYIAKTKSRLSAILSALEWNEVDTLKESTCSGHLMLEEQKDDPCDPLLPESFESKHSIVIGEGKLKQILDFNAVVVPKKFSDIQVNFTREQKLALYDYVILNTGKISEPELKVSTFSNNQGPSDMTFAEIVAKAKKKDKKLRRRYRTSKPTHIEEVRNLVQLQMQALVQYFNPKSSENEKYSEPGCSRLARARERSRSLSRDRRRSKLDREYSRKRRKSYDGHSIERKTSRTYLDDGHRKHSKKKSKKRSHKSTHKSSKSKKTKHHRKSKTNSN